MRQTYTAQIEGAAQDIEVESRGGDLFRVAVGDEEAILYARQLRAGERGGTLWLLPEGGGPGVLVSIEGSLPDLRVTVHGQPPVALKLEDSRAVVSEGGSRPPGGPAVLRAPMPGKVVKLLCQPGQAVKAGQGLIIIEAMKMENEIRAPHDGTVREVRALEGQSVEGGGVLIALE